MKIREFELNDYDAVIKIWEEAGLTLKPSDELSEIKRKLERDSDLFLVAEEDGQVVGAVIGAWDGRRGWIYHLAVSPSAQKQGIGLQLMEELETRMRQKGVYKVNLLVERNNSKVINFYERLGYEIDDIIFMGKKL